MATWSFAAVAPTDADDLIAFFGRSGSACFCRYWHFGGDKNAWLDRVAHAPGENARELAQDLENAGTFVLGVVARDGPAGPIVGWMKLSGVERLQKLYDQRLYKRLPCFDGDRTGVLAVGCFLVEPGHRRHGVAFGLLGEGIRVAQAAGARVIEAFPRRAELLGDEEMWMGPHAVFEKHGFHVVHEFGPYPVLRRTL